VPTDATTEGNASLPEWDNGNRRSVSSPRRPRSAIMVQAAQGYGRTSGEESQGQQGAALSRRFLPRQRLRRETLDTQPEGDQLGSTPSLSRTVYSRLAAYQGLIASAKTPQADKAYALYRAVMCYAPSGNNSCGGKDVDPSQRKAWFLQLKKNYPNSLWAKELQYFGEPRARHALRRPCRSSPGLQQRASASTTNVEDYDAFWLWAGVKPQSVLAQAHSLYLLQGEVTLGDPPRLIAQRSALPRIDHAAVWMVVRVQPGVAGDSLCASAGGAGALARFGNDVVGVQIDFDAATHHLQDYAAFLGDLRRGCRPRRGSASPVCSTGAATAIRPGSMPLARGR